MKPVLLVLAAGMGSRYGGVKQIDSVGQHGECLLDFATFDAKKSGFGKVVFVIRPDIEKDFRERLFDRVARNFDAEYVFQTHDSLLTASEAEKSSARTKPWGTGQAVLAAKKVIKTPFVVINADDYYGKEGFKAVHEYLVNGGKSCMEGFVLKNTLSDNGGVTRGICKIDKESNLTEVVETKNIAKTVDGAEADDVAVEVNSLVFMNMWGICGG